MAKEFFFSRNCVEYQDDLHNSVRQIDTQLLRNKSFLITGATGLIGTLLIDALMMLDNEQNLGIKVFAVGRNRDKAYSRLGIYYDKPDFEFIQQDIQNPLPQINVDYIISGASNTHPLQYQADSVGTILTNIIGTQNVMELAKSCGASVLLTSSVEVYGENRGDVESFSEDYTGTLPLDKVRQGYPESKRASEVLCLAYNAQYGVDVKIARLSRSFGPTMLMNDSKASSQFIKNALIGDDIVLKSSGMQLFSYTYSADVVSAMLYILLYGKTCEAYNISNKSCDVRLKDFAEACAGAVGRKVVFDLPSDAESKGFSLVMTALLDNGKLLDLGWKPMYSFSDAIKRTIAILS